MSITPEALPPLPERATISLTLADLQILAATARGNDTHHAFQAVALEWCGKAHAEIERLRAALAQRQQVPTTAWLVEWRFNGVQWLYLWPSAPGGFSFTSDASKALRFARREDAEAALQWARDTDAARRPIGSLNRHGLALGEMLVTEHDWPALTAAPRAQAEPTEKRQSEFVAMVREAVAASKAAPVGTAVPLPPSLTAEFRKFMRDEPSAFDGIAWGEFKALAAAAPPTAQAEPQEPPQRPALVTALRGLLASLHREPTEFELRAAAHEFTVQADRIAAGRSRREEGDG